MTYVYWYLGIGLVLLAAAYGAIRLKMDDDDKARRQLLRGLNPDRKRLSYLLFNISVAIVAIAVWPLVLDVKVRELRQKKAPALEPEAEFAVESQHLLERLTAQEVERREVVDDPLKAVPDLPFGHLHKAWKEFLNGHSAGDELWSFSALWQTRWGGQELRSGYVIVRDGMPGTHFLTVWKDIPESVDGGARTPPGLSTNVLSLLRKQSD